MGSVIWRRTMEISRWTVEISYTIRFVSTTSMHIYISTNILFLLSMFQLFTFSIVRLLIGILRFQLPILSSGIDIGFAIVTVVKKMSLLCATLEFSIFKIEGCESMPDLVPTHWGPHLETFSQQKRNGEDRWRDRTGKAVGGRVLSRRRFRSSQEIG